MQGNNVGNEFKAVAQDVMQLGARCVQAGREWLTERRNEMTNRNEEHGQGQGPANRPRSSHAEQASGHYQPRQYQSGEYQSRHAYGQHSQGGYEPRHQTGEGYGTSSGYGTPGQDSYNDTAGYRAQDFATPGDTQPRYGGDVRRQSYAGRGPRNYTRSDERITEDLCERLTQDHDVDASDIDVRVSGGTAMLEGTVPQRWMKHRAEDLADGCSGVRTVENRLRVQSEASGSSGAGSVGAETPAGSASRGRSGGSETGSPTTPTSSAASSGTTPSANKPSGGSPH